MFVATEDSVTNEKGSRTLKERDFPDDAVWDGKTPSSSGPHWSHVPRRAQWLKGRADSAIAQFLDRPNTAPYMIM